MKLCVPIIEKEVDSFINAIKRANDTNTDLVELRIDYLKTISAEVLDQILATKSDKSLILTIRTKEEGGMSSLDEKIRQDLFLKFQDKVDYVDVEFAAKKTAKALISEKKSRIIISMHDFENTPPNSFLSDFINQAFDFGADIAKIAVMCNSFDDSLQLLELLDEWKNKNVIIIGMGEFGTLTRLLSPMFNPYMTFVSADESSKSAPGQITLNQMGKILDLLNKSK